MSDPPYPGSHGGEDSHSRRHKRKRKKRKQLIQKIVVITLFVLVCAGALAAWHFLVQEPPPRTAAPERTAPRLPKA